MIVIHQNNLIKEFDLGNNFILEDETLRQVCKNLKIKYKRNIFFYGINSKLTFQQHLEKDVNKGISLYKEDYQTIATQYFDVIHFYNEDLQEVRKVFKYIKMSAFQ